jgi:hypothetical protein
MGVGMNETTLASTTWQAFVDGWDIQQRREIARAKSPQRISLNTKMKMSDGGQYAVGNGINAPVDPVSGVPIVGA